jgi:molybdopterin synthase sulfur carrier subunit
MIAQQGGRWQAVLSASNIISALNQQVVDQQQQIKAGDELAFYPPVTGG